MSQRDHYLKEIWSSYPAAPKNTASVAVGTATPDWWGGEVSFLSATELVLSAQGRDRQFSFSKGVMIDLDLAAAEILIPGDKVAVQERDGSLHIQLLAPCLGERPKVSVTPETIENWGRFLAVVRDHWLEQGFLEVGTPSLVRCPGFEPTIEPVPVGSQFLPTSPEIHLKKILAAGWTEVFEIRSCFRAGEFSEQHQPEFTMLEWYRSFAQVESLVGDLQALLERLNHAELVIGEKLEFSTFSVSELFLEILQFSLKSDTTEESLQSLCRKQGISWTSDDSWNDLFHRLWVEFIDPWLAQRKEPVIVTQFPASQAALARIGADGWAERVELYWRGLEIANGFHELNDPVEQARRSESDLVSRVVAGRSAVPMDESFIEALRAGMAPAAGMALGLERLFMAAQGIADIRKLKAFPYES